MEKLLSKRFTLPTVYFITDREEIEDIPIGVPYIFGSEHIKRHLVRYLEYEILLKKAMDTGLPFDFRKILRQNGYSRLKKFHFSKPEYGEYKTKKGALDPLSLEFDFKSKTKVSSDGSYESFLEDSVAVVNIQKLKELNVFPIWLNKIEEAIHTNIHNFAQYNNNMYNKKLEGMYGAIELTNPHKNLIIIDISGSIPKAVSSTCLTLAKHLAETFYADLLITGTKSTLYDYLSIPELNVSSVYKENGMNNDQFWFKGLLTEKVRNYNTAIVFGDNHSPCMTWGGSDKTISREDGRKMCKWTINKLISFHTTSEDHIAGYADWFSPKSVEKIKGWVKYLN